MSERQPKTWKEKTQEVMIGGLSLMAGLHLIQESALLLKTAGVILGLAGIRQITR